MRRTLLFIACVLASVTMLAQNDENPDYLPFVELGKQWHLIVVDNPNYLRRTGIYWMRAEMEFDNKKYIYTYLRYDVLATVEEVGFLREENRRVYLYDEYTDREIMLYDFSLKEGDIFTYEYGFDQPVNCKVLKQGWLEDGPKIVSSRTLTSDTQDINYRPLRTWTIGRDNGAGEYDEVTTWVEGIGTIGNMFSPLASSNVKYCLTFVERQTESWVNEYLPFSFCNLFDMFGQIHGCDLPTGEENNEEDDRHHKLTYELEGERLHVYGDVFTQCGPNNYALFRERKTDDPWVNKIEFTIQEVEPTMNCAALYATDFYVPGFDPNLSYVVVDNQGEEHPVINKTSQMAYRPFIEDGKVWKVGDVTSGNPVQLVEYYYFDGDTIIDGKTCKQMMRQQYVSPDFPEYEAISQQPSLNYVGAWYEEDKKVYEYDTSSKQFKLKYDFTAGANDTLQINDQLYVIGPKQTGGLIGFKGVYREVRLWEDGESIYSIPWLEGVGGTDCPTTNVYPGYVDPMWFLMSCTVGDEVIYFNDEYEDGATPDAARKQRIDFNHTIKTKPKAPRKEEAEPSLYGEYNNLQLDINLNPLADAYVVRITDETGKAVYEKAIDAASIVGLNIDISSYSAGRYTVTVENSSESFTGEFETQLTGISDTLRPTDKKDKIYNLQGQRISTSQKGLRIEDGRLKIVK